MSMTTIQGRGWLVGALALAAWTAGCSDGTTTPERDLGGGDLSLGDLGPGSDLGAGDLGPGSTNLTLTLTTSFAGERPGGVGSVDGVGPDARLNPAALAADATGHVYVADYGSSPHPVRRLDTASGAVTTIAMAPSVGFAAALDGAGHLFLATASLLYQLDLASGATSLIAGGHGAGSSDGPVASASFRNITGLASDGAGRLFIVEQDNHDVRQLDVAAGQVTTLAGLAGQPGSADGAGAAARFNEPNGASYAAGKLYLADMMNSTIRQLDVAGRAVTTLAGSPGMIGSSDGVGAAARFSGPLDVVADGGGRLYVADTSNRLIRRIDIAGGAVTTLAGAPTSAVTSDGVGALARFTSPIRLAFTGGHLYVGDSPLVRQVDVMSGAVLTVAGAERHVGSGPTAVAADGQGGFVIANRRDCSLRRVALPGGAASVLAGYPRVCGSNDGAGTLARLHDPSGLAFDGAHAIYLADGDDQVVRRLDLTSGLVTTLAGAIGEHGNRDGAGASARFYGPAGLALDGAGHLFIADSYNHAIRQIDLASGQVTTLAGAGACGSSDGGGAAARFCQPLGLASDGAGHLFVADSYNHALRQVAIADGSVTTFAGHLASEGAVDGIGDAARFNRPAGVAFDGAGRLFVADTGNGLIRRVTLATRAVATINVIDAHGTTPSMLHLSTPTGVAVLPAGGLVIADADADQVFLAR